MNNKIHGLNYLMVSSFIFGCGVTLIEMGFWLKYNKHYKLIK